MQDNDDFYEAIEHALFGTISFFIVLSLCFLLIALCGCTSTKYVPVETVRTEYREADTTAIYNRFRMMIENMKERENRSDSLIDHTNESATVNEQGDTIKYVKTQYIYLSSYKEHELERIIGEKDSVIEGLQTKLKSVKADTISVPYPVERELSKWEKTKMDFGGIAFGATAALILGFVIVWLIKRKTNKVNR